MGQFLAQLIRKEWRFLDRERYWTEWAAAKAGKPATVDVDVGLSARFAESKPKIPEGADAHAPFQFPVSVNDGGRDTTNVAGEELPPPGGGEDTTTGNEPGIDNFGSVTLICDGLRNDAV